MTTADARSADPPEAVSQKSPGSLGYARDLPTFWLESAPFPFVSGPVRGGGSWLWPPRGDFGLSRIPTPDSRPTPPPQSPHPQTAPSPPSADCTAAAADRRRPQKIP